MRSIFILILIKFSAIKSSALEDMIDANDILNADLMPSSLMIIDGPYGSKNLKNNQTKNSAVLSSNGSWFEAFATMGFHRYVFKKFEFNNDTNFHDC